jgi:hypothetical protein
MYCLHLQGRKLTQKSHTQQAGGKQSVLLAWLTLQPLEWTLHIPLKCRCTTTGIHCVTWQMLVHFPLTSCLTTDISTTIVLSSRRWMPFSTTWGLYGVSAKIAVLWVGTPYNLADIYQSFQASSIVRTEISDSSEIYVRLHRAQPHVILAFSSPVARH